MPTMKTNFTSILKITLLSLLFSSQVLGWGNDVIISQQAPLSQHSIAAKQNGILYAGVPTALLILQNTTLFYTSADDGATWTLHPVTAPQTVGNIVRTKMVVTSLDSLICVIQQDNTLYFVNVESGVTGQFTTTGVQDFDVAAGTGNFIYTYVQEPNLNTIKRYGTGDGGLSWTGNTATVTSQGSRPRISMSGTRLILNYYGPVLPDTVSSVIRAAFYNETAAGTLAAGTFQDIVVNTGVKKKQFQTILNNGIAWFVFTEGDAQQVIKCRVSTDDGATYQPEFTISGDANVNAYWFGAAPVTYSGTFGVTLTWLADSIAPSSSFDKMYFATATNSLPGVFVIPAAPLDTYNDYMVLPPNYNSFPILVNYNIGLNVKSGVSWVGEIIAAPSLFYDRLDSTTGLSQTIDDKTALNIYPSPASEFIVLSGNKSFTANSEIEIHSMEGKLVLQVPVHFTTQQNISIQQIDISALPSGNYILKVRTGEGTTTGRFSVVK